MNRPRKEIMTRKFDEYLRNHCYKVTQKKITEKTIKHGFWQGEMDTLLPDGKLVTFQVRTHLIKRQRWKPMANCQCLQ